MRSRTSPGMSTYDSVVISPATTTRPVVISVSHATRAVGSFDRTASRTESEIWSAILSGWPSVTDSEVKENERVAMRVRLAAGEGETSGEGRGTVGRGRPGSRPAGLVLAERDRGREAGLPEGGVGRELRAAASERRDPARLRREDELAAD